jgi:hypothetical protein
MLALPVFKFAPKAWFVDLLYHKRHNEREEKLLFEVSWKNNLRGWSNGPTGPEPKGSRP